MTTETTTETRILIDAAVEAEREYRAAATARGAAEDMTARERRAVLACERTLRAVALAIRDRAARDVVREAMGE